MEDAHEIRPDNRCQLCHVLLRKLCLLEHLRRPKQQVHFTKQEIEIKSSHFFMVIQELSKSIFKLCLSLVGGGVGRHSWESSGLTHDSVLWNHSW